MGACAFQMRRDSSTSCAATQSGWTLSMRISCRFCSSKSTHQRSPESEITASEAFYRDQVLEAARRLVARFAREDPATPYEY